VRSSTLLQTLVAHEGYRSNWAGPVPMVVLDRYRMQEVA